MYHMYVYILHHVRVGVDVGAGEGMVGVFAGSDQIT